MSMRQAPFYYEGDVTEMPKNTVLAHVCNNAGGWGAGVVLAISKKWSQPEVAYREWAKRCAKREELLPLGNVQFVPVGNGQWVANMIAQTLGRPEGRDIPLSYVALKSCLQQLDTFADSHGLSIAGPRFGSGLAGGDWDRIETLIRGAIHQDTPVTIYDYNPNAGQPMPPATPPTHGLPGQT